MSKGKWPSLRWSQPVMSYNTSGGSPFISQEAQPTMATKRKHRKEGAMVRMALDPTRTSESKPSP